MISSRVLHGGAVVAALLIGFPASVQAAKRYEFQALVPPELNLAGVRTVVVFDFATEAAVQSDDSASSDSSTTVTWRRRGRDGWSRDQDYGRSFALGLKENLSSNGADSSEAGAEGAPCGAPEVLPSYHLMREFSDAEHSIEAVIEACTAHGADAIIWGDLNISGTTRTWEETDPSSDDGTETVSCSAADVRAEVAVRVFSTEDGRILGSKIFAHSDSASGCDTDQPGSLADLVDETTDTLLAQATKVLAPTLVEREVLVLSPGKRKARKETSQAFELAEGQAFGQAVQALEEVHSHHSSDPTTVFNLGAVFEMADRLDEAEDYYRQAAVAGLKDEGDEALARIANRRLELSRLESLGCQVAGTTE